MILPRVCPSSTSQAEYKIDLRQLTTAMIGFARRIVLHKLLPLLAAAERDYFPTDGIAEWQILKALVLVYLLELRVRDDISRLVQVAEIKCSWRPD